MRPPAGPDLDGTVAPAEAGGVALFTLMASAVMLTAGVLAVGAATDVALAHARASSAADAAALAAVAASPLSGGDGDARASAHRLAADNGATLERLDEEGWPLEVVVEVAVPTSSTVLERIVPAVRAEAAALLVPEGA